ncbi:MAG: hypothetical protein LLG13_06295 [Bacteroidales bacterium]|nr:hypothetical protein [Bacteroidales bacterium]
MRSALLRISCIFFLVLFMTGCKKNPVISDKQDILFQFEYVNHAWSNQHNGFIIDNEGNVLAYNNPADWNFPDSEFSLTETQVSENISMCINTGKKIPKEELQKYSKFIRNIASSKITALKNTGINIGSLKFVCYQYSESSGMYKGCLIKMEGDFSCENLNFYSKKIVTWMREINNDIAEN